MRSTTPLGWVDGLDFPGRGGALVVVVVSGWVGSCCAGSEDVTAGEGFFVGTGHPGRPGFVVSGGTEGFEVTEGSEGTVVGGSSELSSHMWRQQSR